MADIKIKDLRYLTALADTGHFGRAAARCFVSQPTLSAQLRKLEAYLGVQLVERRPRHVALTEAGAVVAQRARRILETSEEIVTLAHTWRDPLAGRLRVALLPTVGPYLLPHVVLKIRRALPRLELMLYEYQTATMLEQLHNGELDVGILALPEPQDGMQTRALYAEPFMVALPTDHALAGRTQLRVADLAGDTLLLLEDGHCLREQALAVCGLLAGDKGDGQDSYAATSLHTLVQMVAGGLGVTLLPR
ncbi:MAG TPA: LysR substrate-binding domain-containing protein, partial [Steroidobacteraceae bacterium]